MKVRTGFISNSSTSSFILVGIEIDWEEKNRIEGLVEHIDYIFQSGNNENIWEFSNGFGFIVKSLSEDLEEEGGEYFDNFNKEFNENMSKAKKNIEKIIEEFKLDKNKYKVKVFAGTFHT